MQSVPVYVTYELTGMNHVNQKHCTKMTTLLTMTMNKNDANCNAALLHKLGWATGQISQNKENKTFSLPCCAIYVPGNKYGPQMPHINDICKLVDADTRKVFI